MLAQAVLSVVIASNHGLRTVSLEEVFRSFGREMITVDGKSLNAEVGLFVGGQTRTPTDESRVFNTVRVRPGSPATEVRIGTEYIGAASGGERDLSLGSVYLGARSKGAEADIGVWLAQNTSRPYATGGTFVDDPNANLQDGGWTQIEYSLRKVRIDQRVRLVYRYEDGGIIGYQDIDSWTVPIGYEWDYGYRSKTQFFPDAQQNDDLKNSVGGVTIRPGDSELSYTLTLPKYPLGENGYRTDLIPSINSLQYLQLFNKTNGQETIDRILQEGGIDFNRSLELFNAGVPNGIDMNRMKFPVVEGENPCEMDFTFPAGTLWVPDKPGYQTMTTGDEFKLDLRHEFQGLYASTQIAGFDKRTMFTMCTNMDLKEPDGSVRYFAYQPSDPVIPALTGITDRSFRKGPIDQARLWIYTDKASMDKLNQRLFPRVSRGAYTRALMDVVNCGGFSGAEAVQMKMLVPESVSGRFLGKEAAGWAAQSLAHHSPEELGKYLATGPEELIAKATGEDSDKEELVEVMAVFLNSPEPAVRAGAFAALQKMGDRSALKDKVGSLRLLAFSGDAEVEAQVLDVLSSLRSVLPKDVLEFLAEGGGSEDVKTKARAMIGQ